MSEVPLYPFSLDMYCMQSHNWVLSWGLRGSRTADYEVRWARAGSIPGCYAMVGEAED